MQTLAGATKTFDAYRRLEIALADGWQIVSEIEECMATADNLRHQWKRASSGFAAEASEFGDLHPSVVAQMFVAAGTSK